MIGVQQHDDPIVALATPFAPSALAVVRTSGADCIAMVARLCARADAVLNAPPRTAVYTELLSPSGELLDEVIVTVYRSPRSYTGEDLAEISCHGSLPGIEAILDALTEVGFRQAEPGEFTRRGFLNGKLDLTRAEAVDEIIGAKTREAQALALSRLHGAVYREIDDAKRQLLTQLAAVEVQLDYPEEDVEASFSSEELPAVRERLLRLSAGYHRGRLYRDGVRVAIAGPTNAGKSSLFNLLLRHERAIVSATPGTTRDYLEADIAIRGVPVQLFDTAGFRSAVEVVESEGIDRSGMVSRAAHLVLYVIDATVGLSSEDERRLQDFSGHSPVVVVWNKTDLEGSVSAPGGYSAVPVSAATGGGLSDLEARIVAEVTGGGPASGSAEGVPVIESLRQKRLLDRAVEGIEAVLDGTLNRVHLDLIAVDLKDAVDALGEITGEVTSADILDEIFAGFCVGK